MQHVSQGIAEAVSITLNRYDLTDTEYDSLYNGAVEVFSEYVETHKPGTVLFDIGTCTFLDNETFAETQLITEQEQEDLLHAAEAAADKWIEDNI